MRLKKLLKTLDKLLSSNGDHNRSNRANHHLATPPQYNAPQYLNLQQQGFLLLPLPLPVPARGSGPWNVIKSGFGHKQASIVTYTDPATGQQITALRVDYIPGLTGSASGFGFYASPHNLFPAEEAILTYQLFVPQGYNYMKGGKLPGLFIGTPGASGGNWSMDQGSCRVCFKPKGLLVAYCYVPLSICGGCRDNVPAAEGPEYQAIAQITKDKGHHLWHKGKGFITEGQWNSVSIRVRMNTPGARDGLVELTVNGVKQSFEHMVWRPDTKLKIGGIAFHTFFGGSGPEAAAPPGAFKMFKDFAVWAR